MKKYVIKDVIRTSYAKVAANGASKGCCSGGCGCSAQDAKASSMKLGYSEEDVNAVPIESNMGLGCGNPLAIASLKAGETVVDMGCGGGFDCFLARKQVGESGYVIGVDMTPDMVTLARKNVEKSGYSNIDIR
ncbi:MAG: methyltransferase domain-containing protein, partial [Clostridia bacterium]|nr:methyltransferase domain-containing protein [Clostridia bacterium]